MNKRQTELEEREGIRVVVSGLETRIMLYLFKFRFLDIKLIMCFDTAKISSVRRCLDKLLAKGLVTKRFHKSYRLLHLPAVYSLSPGGVTYLKHAYPGLPLRSLQLFYKNHLILDSGVHSAVFIAKVYGELIRQVENTFEIFSRYELLASRSASEVPDLRAFSSDDAHSTHVDIYGVSAKLPRTSLIKIIRKAPDRRSDTTHPVHVVCEDEKTLRRVYVLVRKYGYLDDFKIRKLSEDISFESVN